MERLTEKVFGFVQLKACGNDFCKETCAEHDEEKSCKNCHIQKAFEKLAKYEDLEEQGRLIKLPCKVGDVVYFAHHDRVISSEVLSAKYHAEAENHGVFIRERLTIDVEGVSAEIDFGDIGKTVFLTKAESEQKLKEMESD